MNGIEDLAQRRLRVDPTRPHLDEAPLRTRHLRRLPEGRAPVAPAPVGLLGVAGAGRELERAGRAPGEVPVVRDEAGVEDLAGPDRVLPALRDHVLEGGAIARGDPGLALRKADRRHVTIVGVGDQGDRVRVVDGVHAALDRRAHEGNAAVVHRERAVVEVLVVHELLGAALRVEPIERAVAGAARVGRRRGRRLLARRSARSPRFAHRHRVVHDDVELPARRGRDGRDRLAGEVVEHRRATDRGDAIEERAGVRAGEDVAVLRHGERQEDGLLALVIERRLPIRVHVEDLPLAHAVFRARAGGVEAGLLFVGDERVDAVGVR